MSRKRATKRATRIPEPFVLTREMRTEMHAERPALDLDQATKQFVDYWRAASGASATKKDWVAAWRFWMRREADRLPTGGAQQRPLTRTEQNLAAVAEIAAREEAEQRGIPA